MVMVTERPEAPPRRSDDVSKRLGAVGWGVFFLWVGYAILMEVPIGAGLIGIGAIALLMQVVRTVFELPLEGFWILVGIGFVISGAWNVYAVNIPLAPVLLLGLGLLLVAGALLGTRWGRGHERHRSSSED